jgi:hypothetical protein
VSDAATDDLNDYPNSAAASLHLHNTQVNQPKTEFTLGAHEGGKYALQYIHADLVLAQCEVLHHDQVLAR